MLERITVFQTTRFLGDFLLSLALVKECLHHAEDLSLVVHSSFQDIARLTGAHVIPVLKPKGPAGVKEIRDVVSQLRPGPALLAHKSLRTGITAAAAGLKPRVGFAESPARSLYTHKVPRPRGLHESQVFKLLLKPLGFEPDPGPEMWFAWKEQALSAAKALNLPRKYAVVAPGASWVVKQWPVENFAAVGKWLMKQGITPVITGGAGDLGLARRLASSLPGCLNLAGKTDVLQFMGVVAGAELVISGDSAPMHAAGCFDRPTVAIYGPTTKEMGFWPLSSKSEIVQVPVDCRPCSARASRPCPKGHHRCMRDITPEMVISSADRVLD